MADTAKHTPGPWFCTPYGDIRSVSGDTFVGVSLRETREERDANANLISAAPDLLEFAKHVHDCILKNGEYAPLSIQYVYEIIAKAEGRS